MYVYFQNGGHRNIEKVERTKVTFRQTFRLILQMHFQFKILFVGVAKLLRLGEVSLPPPHSVASVSMAKNMHPLHYCCWESWSPLRTKKVTYKYIFLCMVKKAHLFSFKGVVSSNSQALQKLNILSTWSLFKAQNIRVNVQYFQKLKREIKPRIFYTVEQPFTLIFIVQFFLHKLQLNTLHFLESFA